MEGFAAFAAHEFLLAAPQSDGASLKEHLVSAWERSGKQPAMLANGPALPDACGQLWVDFLHMHQRRGYGANGPERITDIGIDAWQRLHGVRLAAWELDAINRADNAFLTQAAKGAKRD